MNIAVIGGGINGIMTAWQLLKEGHHVTLFEKHKVMSQTSSASSKLLHGGLRYLENGEFRLVSESLKERGWWIEHAPHLAQPLKFILPVYQESKRSAWQYKLGLFLYDFLAGKKNIGKHENITALKLKTIAPELKSENLVKAYAYFDAQMDDYKLGQWALEQALMLPNLIVLEQTKVSKVDELGRVEYSYNGKSIAKKFDKIVNVAGPWSQELLEKSNIKTNFTLDLIRGSHILVNCELNKEKNKYAYLLEASDDQRVFFVIPFQGLTLIGTTEVRQKLDENIIPSEGEINYLLRAYNHYFKRKITTDSIVTCFAGVRPLIKSSDNPNKLTREYAIQTNHNLITVYGGKWTTSRQLAKKVSQEVDA